MTLRKLCNHPDLVTNDYCELRKLCNGEEGGGREDEDFATIDVSTGKRRKKQRCKFFVSLVPSPSHPSFCLHSSETKAGVGRTGSEATFCS